MTAFLCWGLACGVAGLVLAVLNGHTRPVTAMVVSGAFLPLGALVAVKVPHNTIGWIFCLVGLLGTVGLVTSEYAVYGLITAPGAVPGTSMTAWISSWIWALPIGLVGTVCLALFPNGKSLSPRWRLAPWTALIGLTAFAVGIALIPWQPGQTAFEAAVGQVSFPTTGLGSVLTVSLVLTPWHEMALVTFPLANPLGWERAAPLLAWVIALSTLFILFGFATSVASVMARFRRARGAEREQLKWIAFAASLSASIYSIGMVMGGIGTRLLPACLALIGLGTAIPVLRYRLYEIDRIVSRTVSYALLTGLLVAVYLGVVFALQQLLRPITGESQLAVAGATLTVAALFQPARRHVQVAVDRRFNRARYDAQRTVDEFRTRLRDEVDLDQLDTELVAAVGKTVEPTKVTLWLRSRETVTNS